MWEKSVSDQSKFQIKVQLSPGINLKTGNKFECIQTTTLSCILYCDVITIRFNTILTMVKIS